MTREEAIKDIQDNILPVVGGKSLVMAISALQQPERKTGRWIKVNNHTAINCSACHHCCWSLSFEYMVQKFNFCPNCGADMRGEMREG